MRDLLIALIIFGSIPYVFMRPYIGMYLWSWLSYMNPHRLTYGFAFSFPFNQLVALVTLASFFFSKEPKRFPWSWPSVIWLVFVLWTCITTMVAIDSEHSQVEWSRFMKIQLMILFTYLLVNTKVKIEGLVWVISLSIGFYGFKGGIFTILSGGKYLVWGPPNSFLTGNNEIAFAMVVVLPLLYYLFSASKNKYAKWGVLSVLLLSVAAILGSYSRGAFLAMSAMGFMLLLKSDKKIPVLIMTVIAGIAVLSFMPAKYMERMNTIKTYQQDGSAMGRINAWGFAINLANDRPITGGGFTTFREELFPRYAPNPDNFHDAHSIYFEVLGEQGYVGLVLFLLMGAVTFFYSDGTVRKAKARSDLKWARDLAAMLQVGIVGYAVGGAFLGLAYWDMPYHLVALSVLVRKAVEEELTKEAPSAEPAVGEKTEQRMPVRNPFGYSKTTVNHGRK